MPSLDDYKKLLAQPHEDGAHVESNAHGPAVRTKGSKIKGFFTRDRYTQNRTELTQLQTELKNIYGDAIAKEAMKRSGLEEKLGRKDAGPLTLHRLDKALKAAETLHADHLHKMVLKDRDDAADKWKPGKNTVASTLLEKDQKALRMHSVSTEDMQIHAWHPCNRDPRVDDKPREGVEDASRELDKAILAEMDSIRKNTPKEKLPDDRILSLQARMNLLDKMVDQASKQKQEVGKQQVFIAPEWLFSGMEGTGKDGAKISGGALTEKEMQKVTEGVLEISKKHKDMAIVPGSILWSKPLDQPVEVGGTTTPGDMLFNSSPTVQNGKLLGVTYKMTEGIDCKFAVHGLQQDTPYELPKEENKYQTRMQVFFSDPNNQLSKTDPNLQGVLATMKEMADPKNANEWQVGLRGDARAQEVNNVVQVGKKTLAIEICGDHNNKVALENVKSLETSGSKLGNKVLESKGVDGHLIVSAGAQPKAASCTARPGGTFVGTDASEGVVTSCSVDRIRNEGGRFVGALKKTARVDSDKEMPSVSIDTKIKPTTERTVSNSKSTKVTKTVGT